MSIEYDEYDDVYGNSVDDESCISPTDAQQWMYDRDRGQQSIASFITNNNDIKEASDEEAETVADELHKKLRRDSDVNRTKLKKKMLNYFYKIINIYLFNCFAEFQDAQSQRQ